MGIVQEFYAILLYTQWLDIRKPYVSTDHKDVLIT